MNHFEEKDIVFDEKTNRALEAFDADFMVVDQYKREAFIDVLVHFTGEQMKIIFLGYPKEYDVPGIDAERKMKFEPFVDTISNIFDSAYKKLMDWHEKICAELKDSFCDYSETLQLKTELETLSAIVDCLINSNDTPSNMMQRLNRCCTVNESAYGEKIRTENTIKTMSRCQDEVHVTFKAKEFLEDINYDEEASCCYHCRNLYQLCGAILDYLCRYNLSDARSKPRYSLGICERCGRYFVTENRNAKYCMRKDATGKTCVKLQCEQNEKKFKQYGLDETRKKAYKITNRLSASRNNCLAASKDKTIEQEERRTKLYNLWKQKNKEHSKKADYAQWICEAEKHLPRKKGESYDDFYEWLQREEFNNGIH